jgi:protein-disulfide isomerase
MENANLQEAVKKNKEFLFGLAIGIACVSTVALIALVIYVMTGGRSACLAQGSNGSTTGKVAKKFEACLTSGKYDAQVDANQKEGMQLGVQGTPASFINGYLVSGALPYESIKQVIDDLLAGKEPSQDFLKDQETGNVVKVDMPQITEQDHVTGAKNGKITIVEYSDFECPYCGRYKTTIDDVLKNYPNDVTLVFKHFPLSFHQYAKKAAIATECANESGKFWEMYDKLFALNNASTLNSENISKAAVEIGLK